jgi:hypothetical protein
VHYSANIKLNGTWYATNDSEVKKLDKYINPTETIKLACYKIDMSISLYYPYTIVKPFYEYYGIICAQTRKLMNNEPIIYPDKIISNYKRLQKLPNTAFLINELLKQVIKYVKIYEIEQTPTDTMINVNNLNIGDYQIPNYCLTNQEYKLLANNIKSSWINMEKTTILRDHFSVPNHMKVYESIHNGNCFWNSISILLFGYVDNKFVKSLKTQVKITFETLNNTNMSEILLSYFDNELDDELTVNGIKIEGINTIFKKNKYIIEEDNIWAEEPAMFVCSYCLKRRIYIMSVRNTYASLSSTYVPGIDYIYDPIYLLNISGVLYDPILRSNYQNLDLQFKDYKIE